MSLRQRRYRPEAALRLGWVALTLLLAAAAVLAWNTQEQLRGMRQESERVRAQLMAESLSQRIGHAIEVGIPMDALVGVDALFNQRLGAHAEIQSIALMQGPGRVLWFAEREKPLRNGAGTMVDAPVVVQGESRGFVRLTLQESGAAPFVRSAAVLLVPTVLLLAALAYLAARFSEAQGVKLRDHAVRLAMRGIASGRYDRSIVLAQRRGFDLRAQQLGHAVRGVHETLTRVRRLISSLRQTEPQAQRREYLDMLLAEAEGADRFAEHGLAQVRVVAAQAQAFWIGLLLTLSATALLALALFAAKGAAGASVATAVVLLPGLFIAAAAGAAWAVQRRRVSVLAVLFGSCAGLGALALGIAFGVMGDHNTLEALAVTGACAGALAGIALAACTSVEQVPHRPDFKHAMPRWPRASLAAWMAAAVWLGPALGTVTFTALGEFYGSLALTLPLLCAAFLLVRWNEPRSPWRHRMGGAAQAQPAAWTFASADTRARGIAVGIATAVGLLVAQGWMTATTAGSLVDTAASCALGIGMLLGLMDPLRRNRQVGVQIAAAIFLNGLVLLLPASVAWRPAALAGAALLTAYLVGHAAASMQRLLVTPVPVMLAGAFLGVLLAAGAAAAGGSPTGVGLAGAAVLLVAWWALPRKTPWSPARRDSDAA